LYKLFFLTKKGGFIMKRFLFLLASIALMTVSYASPPDPCDDRQRTETVKTISDHLTVQAIYTSQIGVREATGKNDGVQVEAYLKSVNLGKGYAWCAAFVKWCFDRADINTTITAWSPTAENRKNLVYDKGKFLQDPRPGDVFTLYYPSLKRIGHTGFYDKKQNSTIFRSVEGNTNGEGSREGDGVYVKYRSVKATYSISRWTYSSVAAIHDIRSQKIPIAYIQRNSIAA
jgi:hypothetical protein